MTCACRCHGCCHRAETLVAMLAERHNETYLCWLDDHVLCRRAVGQRIGCALGTLFALFTHAAIITSHGLYDNGHATVNTERTSEHSADCRRQSCRDGARCRKEQEVAVSPRCCVLLLCATGNGVCGPSMYFNSHGQHQWSTKIVDLSVYPVNIPTQSLPHRSRCLTRPPDSKLASLNCTMHQHRHNMAAQQPTTTTQMPPHPPCNRTTSQTSPLAQKTPHLPLPRRHALALTLAGTILAHPHHATAAVEPGSALQALWDSVLGLQPEAVRYPRKQLDLAFAVLLMRSGYDTVDDLDFVPMVSAIVVEISLRTDVSSPQDAFQVMFWKLRCAHPCSGSMHWFLSHSSHLLHIHGGPSDVLYYVSQLCVNVYR